MAPVIVIKSLRRAPQGGLVHHVSGRQYRGGQFIPADLWESEKAKAKAALPGLVADLSERLQFLREVYEQQVAIDLLPDEIASKYNIKPIPRTTVESRIKKELRAAYLGAYIQGKRHAGNLSSDTESDRFAILRLRKDEYKYLRKFLDDMGNLDGKMSYEKRMEMYAAAIRESFWLGFLMASEKEGRLVRWTTGPTEHCDSCLRMQGVWKATDLAEMVRRTGWLPQSGALECKGFHCQCSLEDIKSPTPGDKMRVLDE